MLVVIHVVTAVVGFAAVALSGVYGSLAARSGATGHREEVQRYFGPPGRAEWLVLAVPFPGALALALDPGGDFAQAWVLAALVVWLAASAVLLGVIRPAEAQLRRHLANAESTGGDVTVGAGRRLARGAAVTDLAFFVALVLMVIRPG